ncbi:MAG: transcriptional regulator [Robiginitomaculum sp.]|nr:MAG: transcriptional regulator [Robiginitomaculum sp.]
MRFDRLDLNLLVALDALLTERSVSQAAERICLSQSATSSALGRLREYFEDDLLVLKGRQMMMTPRGEELVEPVRDVLEQIRQTIVKVPEFDPAENKATISIMASDYITQIVLADAISAIQVEAPHMKFEILSMGGNVVADLERGIADLLICIDMLCSEDHPMELLVKDDFVVVGWEKNKHLQEPLTLEKFLELGHVVTRFGKARIPAAEEWFFKHRDIVRRVEVISPIFSLSPILTVGTDRVATVHRKMAEKMIQYLPITIHEMPIEMEGLRLAIQWHSFNARNAALQWVVKKLIEHSEKTWGKVEW